MANQKKVETINPSPGQNSIEWLESEFVKLESTVGVHGVMYELIEQAKVIYQKEIELVYCDGYSKGYNRIVKIIEDATQRNIQKNGKSKSNTNLA